MKFQQLLTLNAAAEAIAADAEMAGGSASAELSAALKAASEDMRAMEQPITAEALLADGWGEVYASSNSLLFAAAKRTIYAIGDYPGFELSIWQDGDMELYRKSAMNAGHTLPMPSNVYDLRELVRLLGGENA